MSLADFMFQVRPAEREGADKIGSRRTTDNVLMPMRCNRCWLRPPRVRVVALALLWLTLTRPL